MWRMRKSQSSRGQSLGRTCGSTRSNRTSVLNCKNVPVWKTGHQRLPFNTHVKSLGSIIKSLKKQRMTLQFLQLSKSSLPLYNPPHAESGRTPPTQKLSSKPKPNQNKNHDQCAHVRLVDRGLKTDVGHRKWVSGGVWRAQEVPFKCWMTPPVDHVKYGMTPPVGRAKSETIPPRQVKCGIDSASRPCKVRASLPVKVFMMTARGKRRSVQTGRAVNTADRRNNWREARGS